MIRAIYRDDVILQRVMKAKKKRRRQMSINITRIEFKFELENYEIKNNLLWVRERLYISQDETLHAKILKFIHDFSFENHVERVTTYNRVNKHYYWSRMIVTITQYIKACLHCKRTKHYKNEKQNLLKFLLILERYFQNIFIDFIISLFICRRNDRDYEHIMITMCKLFKKKRYIDMNSINVKVMIQIFVKWIWKDEKYSNIIVFDKDTQFIAHF